VARILIVDDHSFIRRGIKSILEGSPQWEVCGEAENGTDGIKLAQELKPDVILMDVSMPGITGFEAARAIRERDSQVKIILVTLHDSPGLIRNAFRLGMNGYLLKAETERELVRALEQVMSGGSYISPKIDANVVHQIEGDHTASSSL
jgi:DNA-binding NarL/FixJ family response regulator